MIAQTLIAAALASLGAASTGYYNATTSIEVVTAYTTFCPSPTTIVENDQTYTVTEPTTLTITDCPCTRTHTFTTSTITVCASSTGGSFVEPPPVEGPVSSAHNATSAPVIANVGGRANVAGAVAAAGAAVFMLL